MLKRISKIKNIGRFKNASCGCLQLGELTLIFGRNTYGKSTLGDILSSISVGDTTSIAARNTIPNDGRPQEATISFVLDDNKEVPIQISDGSWVPTLPAPLKIVVYDDGFYHNNVFSARQFTRSTKEHFSSFVLGSQGVAKAREIAEKNKRKRAATTEKNKLIKAAFPSIFNLKEFLLLKPSGTIEELAEKRDEKRRLYDQLSKQHKNSVKILQRAFILPLEWSLDFIEFADEINACLLTSLETHHKAARERLNEHINHHFKNSSNAEPWIREGLEQNLGVYCQFCGQKLEDSAKSLIEIYKQSFDESFSRHEKSVATILAKCREAIFRDRISILNIGLEKISSAVVTYPELEENERFSKFDSELAELSILLKQYLENWASEVGLFQQQIDAAIEKKLKTPQIAYSSIPYESLTRLNSCILNSIKQINSIAIELNALIEAFKASVENERIAKSLEMVTKEGKELAREIKRLELSNQCENFNNLEQEIQSLSKEIPDLQAKLRDEQSGFLENYFFRLNEHFKEFGSSEFELQIGEDNSGHTPIYYLRVIFRKQHISERELDRVFSESDRRALSLAVFWARLSGMTALEKENTIVVLDDPVTSFDNNRISTVHRKIIQLSGDVRQIIVLSHYEQELSRFLAAYQNNKNICFLSIRVTNGESTLVLDDIDKFIKSDHEKTRESIFDFIDQKNNTHSAGDLRIFFEVEINLRFAKQIRELNIDCGKLSDRIDSLKEKGIIDKQVAQKCHIWREALNPSHHTWTGSDIEDQRKTAQQFMSFVYSQLVPSTT